MDKLQLSMTGDCYSEDRKLGMWHDIHSRGKCPQCGALDSMLQGPRGGLAMNIKCKYCHLVFWTTPFPETGAYPIRDDTPTKKELQAHTQASYSDPLFFDPKKEIKP